MTPEQRQLLHCYEIGELHARLGSRYSPWRVWTKAERAAYYQGYSAEKAIRDATLRRAKEFLAEHKIQSRTPKIKELSKDPNWRSKHIGIRRVGHSKWSATVGRDNKIIYLGKFDKEIDAVHTRDLYIIENNLELQLNLKRSDYP